MERKEAIRGAYRMTGGNSFYDGMITCSTLSGKAVCRLVWAMNKVENDAYLEKAMSGIPEHFSGKLLEVPVGTGILTMPVYQTMPEADITCLDYSPDMMRQAREKADRLHLKNVTFRQGDVGALSYADDTFDIVLSLNGFHAFPDKEAAYREVFRVLRPGGTFLICNESNGDTDKDENWTKIIGGMTIYKDAELKTYLEQAGFHDVQIHDVQIHKNEKGWLCILVQKQQYDAEGIKYSERDT